MSRSSLLMSYSGCCCAVVTLLALPLAYGQSKDPMDDMAAESWGVVGQMLGESVNAYADLARASAATTARIAAARDKFAQAPEGKATDAAWKELEKLLNSKDELYLYLAVLHGLDQPASSEMFRRRGTVSVMALGADIDGGIPGPGRQSFASTVTDVRDELKTMGCQVQGVNVLLFLPKQFSEAKDKCKQQWSAYELRRKRVEYDRAGKPLTIADPRSFMIADLQARRDVSFEFAVKQYDALEAAVGKQKMQQAVAAVAESPQDVYGKINKEGLARLGLISSTDVPEEQAKVVEGKTPDGRTVVWGTQPRAVLRGLLTRDNPRVAAMYAMNDVWPMGYEAAWQRLAMIEAAVGKQWWETAVAEFHAAPRRAADGRLITPVPPGDQAWMYRHYEKLQSALLEGDDVKAQVRYFIAIDPKMTAAEDEDPAAALDRRYEVLAKLKGEQELLASAQKLRAAGWKPRVAGVATDRVVAALEKMLGLKGEANPHYFQWAGFGPGTTATYELEVHGGLLAVGAPGGVLKMKREVSVLSANDDSIALRVAESKQKRDGSWEASKPTVETIHAYDDPHRPGRGDPEFWLSMPFVPGGWLGFDHVGPKLDRQEIASILIMNEVFDCTRNMWSAPRAKPQAVSESRNVHPLTGSNVAEAWTSRRAPGWVTKAVRATSNSVTVVRLTSFDAKSVGEKFAGEASNQAESLAWMLSPEALDRIDPDLRTIDVGSRAWVTASVGSSVTHDFHYKGPAQQRNWEEEELNARIVSTLIEKDRDVTLVRINFQQGAEVIDQKKIEVGSADTHYVGNLVTWLASNRQKAHPFLLAGDVARASVSIDGQPVECMSYHHVPLGIPGKQLRAERLVLSESIPGAIVYLSVRNEPGTGNVPVTVTYALEGLDQQSLPELPQLVIKPRGGNFAVEQELMIEKRGKWEKGKILRFTQLPNDAGGRYLIQVGRSPTWYEEGWLREHSRLVSEDAEEAESGEGAPPPVQTPEAATPGRADMPSAEAPGGALAVGSKVRFLYGGRPMPVEGTVIKFHGEGPRQRALVEFVMPGRQRTRGGPTEDKVRRDWVLTSELEVAPASP